MPLSIAIPPALAWAFRAARVRLRFLVALGLASAVVGGWDVLRDHWDRWTAPSARDPSMGAVSADTEYFCPMDPGVLSSWPGKCPICFMATVRRSRGDMGPLPVGVMARVQLSPDRLLLGGIRSEPARHRPLAREIRSVGPVTIEGDRASVACEVSADDAAWIAPGMAAEVWPDPPDGSSPAVGKVRSVEGRSAMVVEVEGTTARAWRFASALIRSPMADREPFRSMPRGDPPIRPDEPRAVFACPDHPDAIRAEAGRCPEDDRRLDRVALGKDQRLGWWCPTHRLVNADQPGQVCPDCGGMALIPRVVTYAPAGEVLAVPESAVIDTGARTVVYVERMPGMFDAVEVRLGPRAGGSYPVVEGLEPGQAVATSGAFLVDAETRLNPSLAAAYFGSRRTDVKPEPKGESTKGTCPVTGKRLGSMGPPVRVEVRGQAVFLCCEGCLGPIRDHPEKYLTKLRPSPSAGHHP